MRRERREEGKVQVGNCGSACVLTRLRKRKEEKKVKEGATVEVYPCHLRNTLATH